MTHVMIDLETLGTTADAVILSIGAVAFDPKSFEQVGPQFYTRPTFQDQFDLHRRVDPSTLAWWAQQEDEPRLEALANEGRERISTPATLHKLTVWLEMVGADAVWGNGADFDNAILQHAAGEYGIKLWPFWANRCFRTFTNLFDPDKNFRPQANDHHALNDCLNQIRWMKAICGATGVELG